MSTTTETKPKSKKTNQERGRTVVSISLDKTLVEDFNKANPGENRSRFIESLLYKATYGKKLK